MKYHDLKIGVVGTGSLGPTLAVELASNGYDVELVANGDGIRVDDAMAFHIIGDFGDKTYLVPTVEDIDSFTTKKDFIILATKAFQTVDVVEKAVEWLTPVGAVVTVQNVFSLDRIFKLVPPEKCICLYLDIFTTTMPTGRKVVDSGGITMGVYDKNVFPMMQVFEKIMKETCETHITNNVWGYLLSRNIMNATISALGAISGLKLGEILDNYNGRYLFNRLIEEGYTMLRKFRVKILPYADKLDYELFISKSLKGKFYNHKMTKIIRHNNRHIRSSILYDLEHGRRTEVEYVIGSFIKYGDRLKFDIPYTRAIYAMLKEIENGERRISPDSFYDPTLVNIDKKRGFKK